MKLNIIQLVILLIAILSITSYAGDENAHAKIYTLEDSTSQFQHALFDYDQNLLIKSYKPQRLNYILEADPLAVEVLENQTKCYCYHKRYTCKATIITIIHINTKASRDCTICSLDAF